MSDIEDQGSFRASRSIPTEREDGAEAFVPCAAAPQEMLRDRIMNPNVAKSEAEWWAARRIEELEAAVRQRGEELQCERAERRSVVEALTDLISWFDDGPSRYGPWIIRAGGDGADEAVEAARAILQGKA